MPHGFEYAVAEIGSASSKTSGPVQVEIKDKYGQFARLASLPTITESCDPRRASWSKRPHWNACQRDRVIVVAALAVITVLAWADLAWLANDMWMGGMDMTGFRMILGAYRGWMMPMSEPWKPFEFAYMFAMWFVMMVGMMMPSAAPMILMYARVGRHAAAQDMPIAESAWFAGGYLAAWATFSLFATAVQWALERAALLTPMAMEGASIAWAAPS